MLYRLLNLWFLLVCACSQAETFLGLEPLEPLSSVKQRFKPENIAPEPAGWLKANQYFCALKTDTVSGKVLLLFEHDDELRTKKLVDLERAGAAQPPQSPSRSARLVIRQHREHLAKPLEQRLALTLMRWIPEQPLPVAELIAKHGKPDQKRERNDTYGPVFLWNKGVTAHLSDDKKFAGMIEYWFTEDDLALYFLDRLPVTR